jgi:hypothetical protein
VLGIGVAWSPTTVQPWEKISIVGQTDASLAGKKAYILKINNGVTNVIDTGSPVSANGSIRTWAKLGRDGELRLIVPTVPVTAGPLPLGTPLLAQSSTFTVKVA